MMVCTSWCCFLPHDVDAYLVMLVCPCHFWHQPHKIETWKNRTPPCFISLPALSHGSWFTNARLRRYNFKFLIPDATSRETVTAIWVTSTDMFAVEVYYTVNWRGTGLWGRPPRARVTKVPEISGCPKPSLSAWQTYKTTRISSACIWRVPMVITSFFHLTSCNTLTT